MNHFTFTFWIAVWPVAWSLQCFLGKKTKDEGVQYYYSHKPLFAKRFYEMGARVVFIAIWMGIAVLVY